MEAATIAGKQNIVDGVVQHGDVLTDGIETWPASQDWIGMPIPRILDARVYRTIATTDQQDVDKILRSTEREDGVNGLVRYGLSHGLRFMDNNKSDASTEKATNPKDAIADNKLPVHLVSGIVKAYQAISHFLGNVKYGAWNYRGVGVRYSIYKAALDRHMDAWWEGEEYDPVDGTPHLANAQACLNILIEAKYTPSSVDDRPPSRCKDLAIVRKELEALMPKIRERYKDKNPKHWTIKDTQ
jgi:hypothetical protein